MITQVVLLISYLLLTGMYFIAGVSKLKNYSDTVKGLSKKPFFKLMPKAASHLAIVGSILLELIAPLLIVGSVFVPDLKSYASYSALSLFVFTLLATLLYHFPPKGVEYYFFMKNITIMGGLLLLYLF